MQRAFQYTYADENDKCREKQKKWCVAQELLQFYSVRNFIYLFSATFGVFVCFYNIFLSRFSLCNYSLY